MKKLYIIFTILFTTNAFADFTCDVSVEAYLAIYEINSYTCNPGYFLPANALGCVVCPNGFTCPGGTFEFNPDYFQGLDFDPTNISNTTINNICANNFPSGLVAIYEPNQHTCPAGQYLPANIDGCTQCPQNSYCGGGTFTFNETIAQGATPCPETHPISSAGSSSINECKKQLNWYSTENNLSSTTTCNYNGLISIPENPPTREGYIFSGWTVKNNNE